MTMQDFWKNCFFFVLAFFFLPTPVQGQEMQETMLWLQKPRRHVVFGFSAARIDNTSWIRPASKSLCSLNITQKGAFSGGT